MAASTFCRKLAIRPVFLSKTTGICCKLSYFAEERMLMTSRYRERFPVAIRGLSSKVLPNYEEKLAKMTEDLLMPASHDVLIGLNFTGPKSHNSEPINVFHSRRHFSTSQRLRTKIPEEDPEENSARFTQQEIHRPDNPLFPDVDIPRHDDLRESDNEIKLESPVPAQTVQSVLTHVDEHGQATMVNVGEKPVTHRTAVAEGKVILGRKAFDLVRNNRTKKGDVLTVSQLAGIMAAKQCPHLIPLCHHVPLDHVAVDLSLNDTDTAVDIRASVECTGRTGVEMEALTAVSVAALTVYDMVKAVSRELVIGEIRLVKKTGGRSGDYEAN